MDRRLSRSCVELRRSIGKALTPCPLSQCWERGRKPSPPAPSPNAGRGGGGSVRRCFGFIVAAARSRRPLAGPKAVGKALTPWPPLPMLGEGEKALTPWPPLPSWERGRKPSPPGPLSQCWERERKPLPPGPPLPSRERGRRERPQVLWIHRRCGSQPQALGEPWSRGKSNEAQLRTAPGGRQNHQRILTQSDEAHRPQHRCADAFILQICDLSVAYAR